MGYKNASESPNRCRGLRITLAKMVTVDTPAGNVASGRPAGLVPLYPVFDREGYKNFKIPSD
jgi:hypothetical protein